MRCRRSIARRPRMAGHSHPIWCAERLETRHLLASSAPLWATVSAPASGGAIGYITSFAPSPQRVAAGTNLPGLSPGMSGVAGFQIQVVFPDATLTPSQQQVFADAAARWSQVITSELPDVSVGGITIDDLQIEATAPFIDGPSGILGQAGPTALRSGLRGLPYQGVMQFDSADVQMMESQGTFRDVIIHEMGHVLGLGTLWQSFGLLSGAGTADPRFTGTNAAREYAALAGTAATSVPVENTGGAGTRDGHWRESVFDTEMMTGFAESAGTAMPISRITVGQFQDLGYTVDYAASDPYEIPGVGRIITVSDVTVVEGNAGTSQATITFALSSAAATAVSVQYATRDGSAAAIDNDYVSATGTVSFSPGETRKTVVLGVRGDTRVESDESFSVLLSNAVGASLGRQAATVTIRNDDALPSQTPTVSVEDVRVVEGNSGTRNASFTISLSQPVARAVTVRYATIDGSALVSDADYIARSGTITFLPGETSKTLLVHVRSDPRVEGDETFSLQLSAATNATIGRGMATATIENDDSSPTSGGSVTTPVSSMPSLSISNAQVLEGNRGTTQLVFEVSLSSPAASPVTVRYQTSPGTASASIDFASLVGSVRFASGEVKKAIAVSVRGDSLAEADETFRFSLMNALGATIRQATATGTIVNDDGIAASRLMSSRIAAPRVSAVEKSQVLDSRAAKTISMLAASLFARAAEPAAVRSRAESAGLASGDLGGGSRRRFLT